MSDISGNGISMDEISRRLITNLIVRYSSWLLCIITLNTGKSVDTHIAAESKTQKFKSLNRSFNALYD